MVRFSCFNASIHRHRSKKSVDGCTERVIREDGSSSKGLSSIIFGRKIASVRDSSKLAASTAVERGWKSEEIKASLILGRDIDTNKVRQLKKSQSHGDELYMDGRIGTEDGTDDGTDRITSPNSLEPNGTLAAGHSKHVDGSPNLYQKRPLNSVSAYHGSDQALNGSIFSVGDHADKDSHQAADSSLSSEHMDNSDSHTPHASPQMVKSNSMPNIADSASGRSSPYKYSSHHSRSSDDLRVLDMRQTEKFVHETDVEVKQDQEQGRDLDQDQDYGTYKSEENNKENFVEDGYDYSSLAKDWIVPATDELKSRKFLKGETSNQQSEFPGHEFKIKRIEDWVNDLQHVNLSDEADEIPMTGYDDEMPKEPTVLNEPAASKGDVKLTPGMEAAKKYISSLSASAASAQLVSHGLVVIPFLSAFVGLRVLNLSGNAIVRITAGALPRGLHVLNLSKNSISVIEGLRDLTRLRVLNLSYNRILRLGHGLASCSSLKELYLAGNKISEIEGLHRLLKLTVLDLRFNKFSTTKSLGQLAANYSSLQAISLEGNPAQKNVGDEQLRKCIVGLLPHLVYFNRQGIKDAADRSVRLGTSTHQLDRNLRSDLKNNSRKSSHGASSGHKATSSAAVHGRKTSALQKRSKDRSSRLPPIGHKVSPAYENHYVAIDNRLSSLRLENSMRRSRSEGTLGPI